LSSADLKELQQQALNLINDSEGRTLWSKLGISDLGICPWDTFFRTYVREVGENLSVQVAFICSEVLKPSLGRAGVAAPCDFWWS
jgi:hypothetical protein